MNLTHGIYKITNKYNDKIYVGYAYHLTIEKRWKLHKNSLKSGKHRNHYLQNDWNAYGESSFTFELIEEITKENENVFSERELYWCEKLKSYYYQNGYNIKEAGKQGKLSKETKEKISKNMSGERNPFFNKVHSNETKNKISQKNKSILKGKNSGQKHYLYGKKQLNTTKQKISNTQKNKYKIKENHPMFGKKVSNETKMKMSKSKQGNKNSFYGKNHSNETKNKISEKLKGREAVNKVMLNNEQIKELCDKFNNKTANKQILTSFNISESTLSKIKKQLWEKKLIFYHSSCASKKQIDNLFSKDDINSILDKFDFEKSIEDISLEFRVSSNIITQVLKNYKKEKS